MPSPTLYGADQCTFLSSGADLAGVPAFWNMFSGLVVMDMLYGALGYFAFIGIPGIASIYFILFHLGMQSYVFTMLTMSFIEEKV